MSILIRVIATISITMATLFSSAEAETSSRRLNNALLIHGLNNQPSSLEPLAKSLTAVGLPTEILTLAGHSEISRKMPETTKKQWQDNLDSVLLHEKIDPSKTLVVAYSFGAVILFDFIERHPEVKLGGIVLFAPAIKLRATSQLLRAISWLRIFDVAIPSFSPDHIRSHANLPLSVYSEFYDLVDGIQNFKPPDWLREIPALVIVSPDDQLIAPKATRNWLQQRSLLNFVYTEIKTDRIHSPYHHLIIDEDSLGSTEWKNVLDNINRVIKCTL